MPRSRFVPVLVALPVLLAACEGGEATAKGAPPAASTAADRVVGEDGSVTLAASEAARFAVAPAARRDFASELVAPARTVAALSTTRDMPQPLMLFETDELSGLWSDLQRARAVRARAATQRDREQELFSRNAAAGKDVLDAETDFRSSEATLRETEGKLRQAGFDLAELGRMRPGTVLVIADVPESRIQAIHLGERARFDFNSFPGETFEGTVQAIGESVDPRTRAVRVSIEMASQGGRIKPGMFARVHIADKADEALVVPLSAIVSADARTFVFVRTAPTKFERREVVLGGDNGTDVVIARGLAAGEAVVVKNAILLKGMSFGF